jgi:hypothetical protein
VVVVVRLGVVVGHGVVLGRLGHAAARQHGKQRQELAFELGLNTQRRQYMYKQRVRLKLTMY